MLNVIIEEDLYDHDFVDKWCYGFDELKAACRRVPAGKGRRDHLGPRRQDRRCRPHARQGQERHAAVGRRRRHDARGHARPARPSSRSGRSRATWSVPAAWSWPPEILSVLPAAGAASCSAPSRRSQAYRHRQDYPLLQLRLRRVPARRDREDHRDGRALRDPRRLAADDEPAGLHGRRPAASLQGAQQARLHRGGRPVQDADHRGPGRRRAARPAPSPSATASAFVSGAAAWLHHQQGRRQSASAKSDMQINLELGKRWNPDGVALGQRRRDVHRHARADRHDLRGAAARSPRPTSPSSTTATRRACCAPTASPASTPRRVASSCGATSTTSAGLDPLPYFEEPEPGPGSTPELMDEYPLVMTIGRALLGHVPLRASPDRAHAPLPPLAAHGDSSRTRPPSTASRTATGSGWRARSVAPSARRSSRPSWIAASSPCDHGWWFPEGDPEKFYDVFDLNINNTLPWIPGKSGFGSNYKSSICKIYKVEEGN